MSKKESIKEQIKKAEKILTESRHNLDNNPEDYSAKLLVVSMENHLSDLYKQLETDRTSSKSG